VHNCEIRNREWQCSDTMRLVSASAALSEISMTLGEHVVFACFTSFVDFCAQLHAPGECGFLTLARKVFRRRRSYLVPHLLHSFQNKQVHKDIAAHLRSSSTHHIISIPNSGLGFYSFHTHSNKRASRVLNLQSPAYTHRRMQYFSYLAQGPVINTLI